MSVRLVFAVALLAAVAASATVFGQSYYPPEPGYYYPPYGYGGGYHASTAEEGMARGMASMMQAAGQRNLLNSEAAKNYEDARSKYLENRLQATNTYFAMKERNQAYREAKRRPRPTSEQLFRLAKEQAPDELSASQLDPLTGDIAWPLLLQADEYAPYRERFEYIFAQLLQGQTYTGGSGYADILQARDEFLAALLSNMQQYPPNDYIAASKFIRSLSYEARQI